MNLFQRRDLYGVSVVLWACCVALAPLSIAQSTPPARVMQSVRNDKLTTLRGNVHPMARAANDRGELPGTQSITRMTLLLQRSAAQETALAQLLAEQQDPKSPNYHAWLTPQQFGERFGPSDSDIQTLRSWLSSQGFSNLRITNGKTLITFDGTAGQVRNAFHTGIHRLSVKGREHFANMQEPEIPEALAPVIAGVFGLHNFHPQSQVKRFGKFQRNMKTGEITPLFTYTNVSGGTFYGVGPADFKAIYNVPSTLDGTGVSIAVVGQSNINLQDVADFRSIFGLSANQPTVILNGPDPGLVSGDEGESDLDVELAGAIAPNASIKLVTTQSAFTDGVSGVDASAVYIVDNNIAAIVSESYGACESALGTAGNQFYQLLWQQAAAQGITVVVSAGDNGSAGCDDPSQSSATRGIAVSGIASTPYNVSMGGTDFNQAGQQTTYWNTCSGTPCSTIPALSAKGYIPEMVWNDSCAATGATGCDSVSSSSASAVVVAGSGGPSAVYARPAWQSNAITGMPTDNHRDTPDVSLFSADGLNNSFYIVCQSDQDIAGDTGCNLTKFVSSTNGPLHDFQGVGGTSAAAPTFAGIMALINQKTGQRQGNANPSLYALGKTEAFASCDSSQGTSGKPTNTTCVFNDITGTTSKDGLTPTLNNSVPCTGASTNCSKTSSGGFGVLTSGGGPAFTAGLGYDLATGLGTPNVANLINAWAAVSATGSTSATVTLSPATVTGTAGTVSGNLSGTVSGGSGTPTGVVVLENSATSAPLQSDGLSGGSYSVAAAMLPAGTYSVKAHYSGDITYAPKDSSPISVTLSKQNSTVLVSFVNAAGTLVTGNQTVAYGSDYFLRIDVENASGTPCQNSSGVSVFVCPSGTITLKDNGSALTDFPNAQNPNASGSAKLNDRGFAEDQPIQLNVGAHAITAAYAADAASSYNSNSSSNTLSVTITQATTSVAVTPSVTSVASGGSITLTATVNSQSNSAQGPTGTVQFKNGTTNLGAAATCAPAGATSSAGASCTAQLTTTLSALPPGFFVDPRPRNTPFVVVTLLAAMLTMLSFVLALKLGARRRRFAFAGAVFAVIAVAAQAGCSGSPGGGGGGGGGSARTISAEYSGDTNYATSSGSTTVTVH
jgi:Pro-kumamolisin, activation domain